MTPADKRRIAAQIVATLMFLILAVLIMTPEQRSAEPVRITTPFDAPQRIHGVPAITPMPESRIELATDSGVDVTNSMADKSQIASSFLRRDQAGHDPLVIQDVVPEDLRAQLGQPKPEDGIDRSLMLQMKREILKRPDAIHCDSFIRAANSEFMRARFTVNSGTPKIVTSDPSDNRVHTRHMDQTQVAGYRDYVTAEYYFVEGNPESVRLEVLIQYYRVSPMGEPLFDPIYLDPFYLNIPVR